MILRTAREQDVPGLLDLAAQVEQWFGPMVGDPGFHAALDKQLRRGTALVAVAEEPVLLGGLFFSPKQHVHHIRWLVVAEQARGTGVGRALVSAALHRYVPGPGTVEVVTFGPDHPGAEASGARAFYERLGFVPGEAVEPGPEGGSRQVYRLAVPAQLDGAPGPHGMPSSHHA